ncbi:MAG: TerB N-terminal domain-containing protein, partial [Coriobacteriales bacterium]
MSRAEEIRDRILDDDRMRESHVFMSSGYQDEPILRTGREVLERKKALDVYSKLIAEKHGAVSSHGCSGWGELFAEQVERMWKHEEAPFSDYLRYDYDAASRFGRLPTRFAEYGRLDKEQLRAYFSWRTQVRKGAFPQAPEAFAYLYASEVVLKSGELGAMEAYEMLARLKNNVLANSQRNFYASYDIASWLDGLVIYYGLDPSLMCSPVNTKRDMQVLIEAERAVLDAADDAGTSEKLAATIPDRSALLDTLIRHSNYRMERSLVYKKRIKELRSITASVFSRMVIHCRKRRQLDFVEGLFGVANRYTIELFPNLLIRPRAPEKPHSYVSPSGIIYTYQSPYWYRRLPTRREGKKKQIGRLLHAIDCEIRAQLGDELPPLKPWDRMPKFEQRIVDEEVGGYFDHVRAVEAAKVTIDRSKLQGIRSAAGRTREALLVDEEREDVAPATGADVVPEPVRPVFASAASDAESTTAGQAPKLDFSDAKGDEDVKNLAEDTGASKLGLTSQQLAILSELLDGSFDEASWAARGVMCSLEVDAINEAFFDVVGDTVLAIGDTGIELVEDYIEDVKEAL